MPVKHARQTESTRIVEKCVRKHLSTSEYREFRRLIREMDRELGKGRLEAIREAREITRGMHRYYRGYAAHMAIADKLAGAAVLAMEALLKAGSIIDKMFKCAIEKGIPLEKYSIRDRGTRVILRDSLGYPEYETRDERVVTLFYYHRHLKSMIDIIRKLQSKALWTAKIYARNLGMRPEEINRILARRAGKA